MFASIEAVMAMTMTIRHTYALAGSLSLFLLACGGSQAVHSGYPEGQDEPWASASKLSLNDALEASAEGSVSFPKRNRASWYVVELPAPGTLTARLTMEPLTTGADVGFEILDAGFNVKAEAEDDNDVGQERKVRSVKDARAGRAYIHVFTLGSGDAADFKLRVRLEPQPGATARRPAVQTDPSDARGSFPATVPNLPPLAAVGTDDSGRSPRRPVVVRDDEDDVSRKPSAQLDPADDKTAVRAQIIEFSQSGSGVKILLNRGSNSGIEEGWTGYVVDSATKKSLPKGSFRIRSVKNDESEGVVNVTLDDVQRNRSVVLKPSK
jgi:hypothetical protein